MFYKNLAPVYRFVFPVENKSSFLARHLPEEGRVLDVGSADGAVLAALEAEVSGLDVLGIDLSEALLCEAKALYPERAGKFVALDMREAFRVFGKATFDGIYCIGNTLVHLEDVVQVIGDFRQMLKPGGVLIIQILNYDKIMRERPEELPLIDNDRVRFERYYEYLDEGICFKSVLTIKGDKDLTLSAETMLYPLMKEALHQLLVDEGFGSIEWFSGFDGKAYESSAMPLIVKAVSN